MAEPRTTRRKKQNPDPVPAHDAVKEARRMELIKRLYALSSSLPKSMGEFEAVRLELEGL